MPSSENRRVVVDTTTVAWERSNIDGHQSQLLYASPETGERVTLERLAARATLPRTKCDGGEEIFLLTGTLADDYGHYGAGTWIRSPVGSHSQFSSQEGALFWAKRGHLLPGS
jgi:anti-sigma factor ChrR (cupin superfamily)